MRASAFVQNNDSELVIFNVNQLSVELTEVITFTEAYRLPFNA